MEIKNLKLLLKVLKVKKYLLNIFIHSEIKLVIEGMLLKEIFYK